MIFNTVHGIIDAYKKTLSVKTDEELASKIGVAKSTIATWRRRGAIPTRIQQKIYGDTGLSFDPLYETDPRLEPEPIRHLLDTAFYISILRLGRSISSDEEVIEFAEWLARDCIMVRDECFKSIKMDEFISVERAPFFKILINVAMGRDGSPEALRQLRTKLTESRANLDDEDSSPPSSSPKPPKGG